MSRRGAVKVNPVTGKMEKADPLEPGKHRDGCLVLDNTYINAAKELGLGGAEGMYQHIKSLAKVGGVDVPYGTSMEREGAPHASTTTKPPAVDARNTLAIVDAIKTSVSQVGRGKVAGFGRASGPSTSIHNHEDAFQRRKGVVNTVTGAKDVNRAAHAPPPALPKKGEKPAGPRVVTMDTVETLCKEGQARIEARDRREAAALKSGKSAASGVHVVAPTRKAPTASRVVAASAGGDGSSSSSSSSSRRLAGGAGATASSRARLGGVSGGGSISGSGSKSLGRAGSESSLGAHTNGGATHGSSTARGRAADAERGVGAQPPLATMPSTTTTSRSTGRAAPTAVLVERKEAGGGSGGGGQSLAAQRAAYFDRKFAEEKARKAEARALAEEA